VHCEPDQHWNTQCILLGSSDIAAMKDKWDKRGRKQQGADDPPLGVQHLPQSLHARVVSNVRARGQIRTFYQQTPPLTYEHVSNSRPGPGASTRSKLAAYSLSILLARCECPFHGPDEVISIAICRFDRRYMSNKSFQVHPIIE
jgi:hypothetical protein